MKLSAALAGFSVLASILAFPAPYQNSTTLSVRILKLLLTGFARVTATPSSAITTGSSVSSPSAVITGIPHVTTTPMVNVTVPPLIHPNGTSIISISPVVNGTGHGNTTAHCDLKNPKTWGPPFGPGCKIPPGWVKNGRPDAPAHGWYRNHPRRFLPIGRIMEV
ncbi:uncharacterized protein TRUGW13939_02936 [Talaromyces rugulosus]|uniref:Ig-like domain-containing protein n=1 Tax=Talaromyces rugulosus TaxID=121627 RepID=A0A7H8QPN7_TALRU|nr:uncharacterized protein TRUGW13939_02936 [Talaromyces rugulosus]QKX55838.1 hypothetical protein TRUGW13939_02936 [Talaromyces rugulosus]